MLGFLSFWQANTNFDQNFFDQETNFINIISQYYKFLSQKDFKNACLLKNTNKDCEKKLKNTYADILLAIPRYGDDVTFDEKNNQITFHVYYEDKKTLRSSVYTVTKKIVNNKITDVSSKLWKPIVNSIVSLDTTNKNVKIYKTSRDYPSISNIFPKYISTPLDPKCETNDALNNHYRNENGCESKAFPIFLWWIIVYDAKGNGKIDVKRLNYMKTLYTKAYKLYKDKKVTLYNIIDHSNLIGNWYIDNSWKKNWYSKNMLDDLFWEGGLCWIGSDFYAVDNLLGYKKWSSDFIKDYQVWDLWAIEPYYAGSKHLLFSDDSRCGLLRTVGEGSYKLKVQ